jgi:hypothetical protein
MRSGEDSDLEGEEYRRRDLRFHGSSDGSVIVWDDDRLFAVYGGDEVGMLLQCGEFARLREHMGRIGLRGRGAPLQQSALTAAVADGRSDTDVMGVLRSFVRDGVLISRSEARRVAQAALSAVRIGERNLGPIEILGIPTRGRGALLARALESYARNFDEHGRSCVICVAVEGEEAPSRDQIAYLSGGTNVGILWADSGLRRAMAQTLAARAGVCEDLLNFALIGDQRCDVRTGAARNTLLLLAAGKTSVQVDDDTICSMIRSPSHKAAVAFSSRPDAHRYRYYKSREDAASDHPIQVIDFLSLHESLLGRHPHALYRAESSDVDEVDAGLLERAVSQQAHIAVTLMGSLGDCGTTVNWPRLFPPARETFSALTEDESTCRMALSTRQILRVVDQEVITNGTQPFQAMNLGLDTGRLLPPFLPVQRKQDIVFSQVLSTCFPDALKGYCPWASVHDNPGRPINDSAGLLAVGPMHVGDLITHALSVLGTWQQGDDPARNLGCLGQYLIDLSKAPALRFQAEVRGLCLRSLESQVFSVARFIGDRWHAPRYWRDRAEGVLRDLRRLTRERDLGVPADLRGSRDERLSLFQELTCNFGRLLLAWPSIWDAARDEQFLAKALARSH